MYTLKTSEVVNGLGWRPDAPGALADRPIGIRGKKMDLEQATRDYEKAYSNLRDAVRSKLPLGSLVKVGSNPSVATVLGYSEGSPEYVDLLFENGNIWSKHVSSISNIGQ